MGIEIRTPTINDLDACSKLIYLSGPHLYHYIFVLDEPEIYGLLRFMLNADGMYSMKNAIIDVENNNIRGLCLAYPARAINDMTKQMLKDLGGFLKILGLGKFIIMINRLQLNSFFPKTYDDEYFVSNIAVLEQYRGKGIAKSLLGKIERKALENEIKKLSLFVEIDNIHAIQVYEKLGYKKIDSIELPKKYNEYGLIGFIKMVKEL